MIRILIVIAAVVTFTLAAAFGANSLRTKSDTSTTQQPSPSNELDYQIEASPQISPIYASPQTQTPNPTTQSASSPCSSQENFQYVESGKAYKCVAKNTGNETPALKTAIHA